MTDESEQSERIAPTDEKKAKSWRNPRKERREVRGEVRREERR